MKIDLAIIGQGVVSPAGMGKEALLEGRPTPVPVAFAGEPDKTWPVFQVDLKDPALVRWYHHPRLRRVSPITLFLVEAVEQALAGLGPEERAETGLIVAFSAGCLAYSRRFFENIVRQGQKTASPALFPETVFNSPVSHVAAVLGLNSAAYALVGDETSWVSAIKVASIWLRQGRVKRTLVLGAEEFDPVVLDAYRSAGWLRSHESADRLIPSEGAAGLLLRSAQEDDGLVISSAHDGYIYRSPKQAKIAAAQLMRIVDPELPRYAGNQRNWLRALSGRAIAQHPIQRDENRPYLGEAFTASAAWTAMRALAKLEAGTSRLALPVWGVNYQFGLLELEKRG
jgi:hypothetical protein